MKYIIYKATFRNGKSYIGQTTTDLEVRMRNHRYKSLTMKSNLLFHNAIRKYGFESITWQVVKESSDWETMQNDEKEYIKSHRTQVPFGYNTTEGGRQPRFTDSTRKKLSEMKKGNRNYNFGKSHSSEHIKKISDGIKLAWLRDGVKEKFIKSRTGKHNKNEKETIEKMTRIKLKEVQKFSMKGEPLMVYKSIKEASKLTGILTSSISNVIGGRSKKAGGFIWKLKEKSYD